MTNQYIETTDVELADCFDTETNTHYAYLSVFDLRDWKVVAYGAKRGRDMCSKIWLVMQYIYRFFIPKGIILLLIIL